MRALRIALLEDDLDQLLLIESWLRSVGHSVTGSRTARDFLRAIARDTFDLYLLDWMLPDRSGIQVLRQLRESGRDYVPVLFVTVKDDEASVVQALEAGADDYMAKPLRRNELLARAKVLARRVGKGTGSRDLRRSEPYSFNSEDKTVSLRGNLIELTHREYDLAYFMFRNAGRVVSRNHILESIWGVHGQELHTRTVDTHISRLRKKMGINEGSGWRLSAIYQHGYRLENTRPRAQSAPDCGENGVA